jgi:hypothetical protein
MLQVSINSREKKAHFELHLKGEPDSFTITVQEYELIHEEAGAFVVVKKATSTRPWINSVITDFLLKKKIPVPEKFANLLKLAL